MSISIMMTVISITLGLHSLDHFILIIIRIINGLYKYFLNLLIKIALTIPRATAGNTGAMAIIAGTVVVVVTGAVTTAVVPPPVAAVAPPPTI